VIEVIKPGLLSLVQDLGRSGYYAIGMPPSGALDQYSHALANLLVGNEPDAATIEVTFIGPELLFHTDALIAVTGATIDTRIDGELVAHSTTLAVTAGQTLTFGGLSAGSRLYLAVRGGIASEPFLGSRSTYTTSKIGGLDGSPLRVGDRLPVGSSIASIPSPVAGASIADRFLPVLSPRTEIRVVEGLCNYRFAPHSLDEFFSSDFTVSPESNRTGYRLVGTPLEFVDREPVFGAGDNPSNVVDLGYPIGSIQVPNGKEAICLLRDAVTGGGYATLGTIIGADLDVLAQAKSPDVVRFTRIGVDEAIAERRKRRAALALAGEQLRRTN
jgi:biotin-dependent carboxylase-like uncharacterized protein